MAIPTTSYEDIYEKYSFALKWMQGIGITIGPGRTSHYDKIVKYWKDSYRTASEEEGREIFSDFVSSMFEIHDFIDIYESFKTVSPEHLAAIIDKLQKAVNGPINASEESSKSTTARNFLFEALMAAKAHQPSKGVEAMLDAKSDTGIKINNRKIWVECKRVTTLSKVEANSGKASSQLETILKKQIGSGHRGIVALDVSKILNPEGQIFVSNNDPELLDSIDRLMDNFITEYSNIWQRVYTRRNKKIIGTIIRFAFMSTSEARNLLVHSSQWGMNPRLGISRSDEDIQRFLAASLKSEL